jgi:hypothetical protein
MPPNPAYPGDRIIRAWRLLLVGFGVVFIVAAAASLFSATQTPLLLAAVFGALAFVCILLAWRTSDSALARWGAWFSGFGT